MMAGASACIFCGIVSGEAPSTTIAVSERAVAFMDINPATHGHALVVPRTHSRDLLDVDPDDLAECVSLAHEIARRATERLGADGVNLLTCSGADAWQTIFHVHIHVLPRYRARPDMDSLRPPWDPTPGDPSTIERVGRILT